MTTFDERERSYEAKFALDEELRFKATARRDRHLGVWVAGQLGLSGAAAEDYAKEVVRSDFKHAGDGDVIAKVLGDLKAKGIAIDEHELQRKLIEFMAQSVTEIQEAR